MGKLRSWEETVKPGDDVKIGSAELDWEHPVGSMGPEMFIHSKMYFDSVALPVPPLSQALPAKFLEIFMMPVDIKAPAVDEGAETFPRPGDPHKWGKIEYEYPVGSGRKHIGRVVIGFIKPKDYV